MLSFRYESDHDERFMKLIEALQRATRLDLLEQHLGLPTLGPLKGIRRRKAYDVHAEFAHRSLIVETKVDSDENNRWEAIDVPDVWQTERIASQHAAECDCCLFITYGFSEFYTKPPVRYDPGPASARFKHITLDMMIDLLRAAQAALPGAVAADWLPALEIEQQQRAAAARHLGAFDEFRRHYLDIGGTPDFPLGRVGFNGPQIAFPVFAQILKAWNQSSHAQSYGRLALYPVGRGASLPADSVLNFWELWSGLEPLTLGGAVPADERAVYFEINEDYNLHLKLDGHMDHYIDAVRAAARDRLTGLRPARVSRPESHKQGAFAVWEWDIDLPRLAPRDNSSEFIVSALAGLMGEVVPRLR